jgi:hypothetical protein
MHRTVERLKCAQQQHKSKIVWLFYSEKNGVTYSCKQGSDALQKLSDYAVLGA